MRVRMLRLMCSPTLGNHQPGAVVDLSDRDAQARVAAGYCAPVDEPRRADEDQALATKPVDKMTVDELRVYAAIHGIDLGEATLKRDLLAAIEAAQDED